MLGMSDVIVSIFRRVNGKPQWYRRLLGIATWLRCIHKNESRKEQALPDLD
jgi:hypothetical protein